MYRVENDAKVFFARKGTYNGAEVTVTHRNGNMVWLEDYPVSVDKKTVIYGCWVNGESVTYA